MQLSHLQKNYEKYNVTPTIWIWWASNSVRLNLYPIDQACHVIFILFLYFNC